MARQIDSRNGAGLVRLQVTDEMPGQVVAGALFDLLEALLDEVLAEFPLARIRRLEDRLDGLFLAHCEQPNTARRATRLGRRIRQQILDFSKVFRDSNHVLLRVLRYTRQPMGPGYGKSDQPLIEGETWPSTLLSCCRSR